MRSPSFSNLLSLLPTMRRDSDGAVVREHVTREDIVKLERLRSQEAADKRTKRHRQAALEKEVVQRTREGKKLFYLTLDRDGKPYGAGKPAWIAEIAKLATGLDPSCTHISKQTYEAVSTFKEWLNQSFYYSEPLNEDYLKTCMAKAVTKKRGDFCKMIKRKERQPLHIDHDVWERLVKYQKSKQHKDKSEQGNMQMQCGRHMEERDQGG